MKVIKKLKNNIRFKIQLLSTIFVNCNIFGLLNKNIYKGNLKNICTPGINCYSCPMALFSCPIGSMQASLNNVAYKMPLLTKIPFYVLGWLMLFGILFGRLICGFICPFGFFQDLLYKIKTKKIKKNKITNKLKYLRYIMLCLFVIVLPICFKNPTFCKYICPAGTLEGGIFHVSFNPQIRELIGVIFSFKILMLVIIVILSIFVFRFFCRFICPLGLIYGFFNKISFFGIKVDKNKCINCGVCVDECLIDINKIGDNNCINCGKCIKICKKNAIYFNGKRMALKKFIDINGERYNIN